MHHITKTILSISLLTLSISFANAQAVGDVAPGVTDQCIDLKNNLMTTSRDSRTNNEVTTLQEFLQGAGFLEADPTGYFGGMTKIAVQKFQRSVNLIDSGYVGAYTRAVIKKKTCEGGSTATTTTSTSTTTSATIMVSTSNSATGPWTVNGAMYNVGPMFIKITGLVK